MKNITLLCVVIVAAISISDAVPCHTGNDCEDDECCVNYSVISLFGGICRKLRTQGQTCTLVQKEKEENPKMYHFQCPCKEGLKCSAVYEFKLGEYIIRHKPECRIPGETLPPQIYSTVLPEVTTFPEFTTE